MQQNDRLPYVQRKTVKGRDYYYFRRDGVYIRLPGAPGDKDFHEKYAQLIEGNKNVSPKPAPETVGALIEDYRGSPEFLALALKTQWGYGLALDRMKPLACFRVDAIRRAHIRRLRDKYAATPRTADELTKVASILFARGVEDDLIDANPAAGIKKISKSVSYKVWPQTAIETYELAITERTIPRWAATAYMLGRYTSQARNEVLRMSRMHYDGASIGITRNKTQVDLWLPVRPALRAYLDALPKDQLYFVADEDGKPFDPSEFSKEFRKVLDGLGLNDLHFHGLRHTTATDLAERGGTEDEIKSITGHRSSASVKVYTKTARQKRLAKRAMNRLESPDDENGNGT